MPTNTSTLQSIPLATIANAFCCMYVCYVNKPRCSASTSCLWWTDGSPSSSASSAAVLCESFVAPSHWTHCPAGCCVFSALVACIPLLLGTRFPGEPVAAAALEQITASLEHLNAPMPGRHNAHVSFGRSGRRALMRYMGGRGRGRRSLKLDLMTH